MTDTPPTCSFCGTPGVPLMQNEDRGFLLRAHICKACVDRACQVFYGRQLEIVTRLKRVRRPK